MGEREILRRLDKLENEIYRMKSNYRPPVRMGAGGGGGATPKIWEYSSVDDMASNVPGHNVSPGDYGKGYIEDCNQYTFFECLAKVGGGGLLWAPLNEYVVDTKAEMDARTWSNGDCIRIAQDPKDQFLVIDGVAVSQKRMAAWESYDGE